MTNFRALLSALGGAGVEFILVGGMAGIAHGAARLTEDLDIVYRRDPQNYSKVVMALTPLTPYLRGAPAGLPFRFDTLSLQRGLNFTLTTSAGDIDLLGEITGGGGFDDLRPYCVTLTVYGMNLLCLGLDRLIHVKRATGRPKDLEAIAELETLRAAQNETIDDPPPV